MLFSETIRPSRRVKTGRVGRSRSYARLRPIERGVYASLVMSGLKEMFR